ncbi:MAG: MerR family transcriptional regulator [Deltaproteobacteria bacterium]|nr:MerR family transcriptional regulator [Deltaproteobacteria bacterium]
MQSDTLTTRPAARYLGVYHQTLRDWTDSGKVPCTRDKRGYRFFKVADLDRLRKELEK